MVMSKSMVLFCFMHMPGAFMVMAMMLYDMPGLEEYWKYKNPKQVKSFI
jgi:hypothetical protein